MKATRWEFSEVPPDRLALGYRWQHNAWQLEPLERDGAYGAMGGLITTAEDFTRYVAFHLSAWPPRDDADTGPVRRSTVREMHTPFQPTGVNATAKTLAGEPNPSANGYGFGLSSSIDSKGVANSRHSGGLPGFGSEYRFSLTSASAFSPSPMSPTPAPALPTRRWPRSCSKKPNCHRARCRFRKFSSNENNKSPRSSPTPSGPKHSPPKSSLKIFSLTVRAPTGSCKPARRSPRPAESNQSAS